MSHEAYQRICRLEEIGVGRDEGGVICQEQITFGCKDCLPSIAMNFRRLNLSSSGCTSYVL